MTTYTNVTVTLTAYEVKRLIEDSIKKDFPNHIIDKVIPDSDGGVEVKLKTTMNYYHDR